MVLCKQTSIYCSTNNSFFWFSVWKKKYNYFFCYLFLSYTFKPPSNERLYNQGCCFISLFCFCMIGYSTPKFLSEWKLWQGTLCESVQGQGKNIRLYFKVHCDVWAGNSFQDIALHMTGCKRLYAEIPRFPLNVLVLSRKIPFISLEMSIKVFEGSLERK